jgi:acyl-CoA thioesterase-1
LVALALAACAADDRAPAGNDAPAPPAVGERARVVFLGTSLTAGLGLDPEQAYPALLQRKIDSAGLRFEAVNAGVSRSRCW